MHTTLELLEMPREADALVAWLADSQSPATCGAVARHQVQEIAIHTHDAQLTAGLPEPLPEEVAVDGAEEFLPTCVTTTIAWPHQPAVLDYVVSEGRAWRLRLNPDGVQVSQLPCSGETDSGATDFGRPTPARQARRTSSAGARPATSSSRSTPVCPSTASRSRGHAVLDRLIDWDPRA